MLNKDMEYFKNTQIRFLEMKNICQILKYTG